MIGSGLGLVLGTTFRCGSLSSISSSLTQVSEIFSTDSAFAALNTDGSVTDIKMASAWAPVMWTHGRVLSELQWLVYSLAMNTTTFKYLVVDKLKQGRWPKQEAKAPSVRVITSQVYPRDVQHLKDIVTQFVRSTDYMTMGADNKGVFPPKPDYRGVQNALGRKTDEMLLTQNNFCQQLCDYKPLCFKECFSGDQRIQ